MSDIKTPEERSKNMSAIRSKNTKPELFLRRMLFLRGYRYRIHSNSIPGHPDLWLRKYNVAIFVNGCFWHRHQNCQYAYMPKSRITFWKNKFEQNTNRDQKVKKELEYQGIRCLIVWECSIYNAQKKNANPDMLLEKIENFLHGEDTYCEV